LGIQGLIHNSVNSIPTTFNDPAGLKSTLRAIIHDGF
jgi:hypothetical protein